MKISILIVILFSFSIGYTQGLPINFEGDITTANFIDFDGGTASVIANPQSGGINTSATVAQIVRNGGTIWSGSKIILANNLDFSTAGSLSMKVFTTAPIGTIVKFKLEGMGQTEIDVPTTVSNEWETLTWDFTGTPANFNTIVFMFDFGNVGNGSATSTFLFDDVEQLSEGQAQIDWPVDFESTTVNYTMTDFDGPVSTLTSDPENAANHVIRTIKTVGSGASSGTTIGRQSGFATNLPLSLSTPKMTVRVWSPNAGTPVRLKVENSSNAAQTCETQTNTTLAGAWETLEFNFANEAPGTAALSFGLTNGWVYNKASIFFNFGTAGATSGERTYYFDDVRFDATPVGVNDYAPIAYKVFPNPSHDYWTIVTEKEAINEIMLFGVQGQLITRLAPNATTAQVEASSLVKGVYIIHVSTDSGTSNVKVVKN